MKKRFYVFLFLLFSANAFAQQDSILGVWRTPLSFGMMTYTFDSSSHFSFAIRACMTRIDLSGNYTVRNDSIFTYYDTISDYEQHHYEFYPEAIPFDTLIRINAHKIQRLYPSIFLYNQDRDQQVCTISPTGLFSFKIRHFGDTLTIKQFNNLEWKTIDTFPPTDAEYINLVNYPLLLHSGENLFSIYVNNRIINTNNTFGNEIVVKANKAKVKITNKIEIKDQLIFSDTTIYEVQDCYGNTQLKGKGKKIDCRTLSAGKYILLFDNRTTEFKKR